MSLYSVPSTSSLMAIQDEPLVDAAVDEQRAYRVRRLLLQEFCVLSNQRCQLTPIPQIPTSEAREPEWGDIFQRPDGQPHNIFFRVHQEGPDCRHFLEGRYLASVAAETHFLKSPTSARAAIKPIPMANPIKVSAMLSPNSISGVNEHRLRTSKSQGIHRSTANQSGIPS